MRKIILMSLLLAPALVQAHPGHGEEVAFAAGALHPFMGADHLLAIIAAGLLMAWLPARTRWPVCAAFLALSGATHILWVAPGQTAADFVLGLIAASAALLAASMAMARAATDMITAAAARSRILVAAAPRASSPSARR